MPLLTGSKQLPPQVGGPMHGVVCPHCGKRNDFRPLNQQQLLDTGHQLECDHCHMLMEVVSIQPVTWISVRKSMKYTGRAPAQSRAAQARTISPHQVRKLLR